LVFIHRPRPSRSGQAHCSNERLEAKGDSIESITSAEPKNHETL
jgi:hypothetical protein